MHRRSVGKRGSVKKFKSRASKTHGVNLASPLRGGIRL